MDGRNTQQIDTIVIGAGQAGLSAGYHLSKRGRAVRRSSTPMRGSATTGVTAGTRSGSTAPPATTRSRACASPRRRPTGRPVARWATTSRRTPDGSTCPSGVGRASIASSRSTAASSCRPRTASASPHARSSSRPGRSGSRTSRPSPSSSTRRSDRCTRTSTATRPSSPGRRPRRRPVALRRRHRVRGRQRRPPDDPLRQVTWPAADPGHRQEAGDARLAGRRVRVRTRAHDAHADGAADAPGDPQGRRTAHSDPPAGTWTGPASSATTRRPSACRTAARCSPTARCSTLPT